MTVKQEQLLGELRHETELCFMARGGKFWRLCVCHSWSWQRHTSVAILCESSCSKKVNYSHENTLQTLQPPDRSHQLLTLVKRACVNRSQASHGDWLIGSIEISNGLSLTKPARRNFLYRWYCSHKQLPMTSTLINYSMYIPFSNVHIGWFVNSSTVFDAVLSFNKDTWKWTDTRSF